MWFEPTLVKSLALLGIKEHFSCFCHRWLNDLAFKLGWVFQTCGFKIKADIDSMSGRMKKILRDKSNFDILEGFLSELLHEQIKIDKLLESEGNQDFEDSKFNRVDLLAHTSKDEKIIVEVQTASEWDFYHRMSQHWPSTSQTAFNDTANAMATSIATRALRARRLRSACLRGAQSRRCIPLG